MPRDEKEIRGVTTGLADVQNLPETTEQNSMELSETQSSQLPLLDYSW